MRVLHLLANFKWTGPADPAIRCAARLRDLGVDVVFAEASWTLPGAEHRMREELRRARLPVIGGLDLRKHFHPPSILRDARALRRRLQRGEFDVLHAHLRADHLIAALARHRCGRRVVLVRTLYDPEPPRRTWRDRIAFAATDAVVAPTRECAERTARRFGMSRERVLFQEPPTEPADPIEADLRRRVRRRLGFSDDHFVVGITARIQPHRRFDLVWEVARRVCERAPDARFVLLGRGNAEDTRRLVREPIARAGLEERVALPGYLYEPDYGHTLQSLDAFLFLVPGSDGTCRAVREAMARGVPVVSTTRGMLPAIVTPGTGIVCAEDAEALAGALLRLAREEDLRVRLGQAARARSLQDMDPVRAAQSLRELYRSLLESAR